MRASVRNVVLALLALGTLAAAGHLARAAGPEPSAPRDASARVQDGAPTAEPAPAPTPEPTPTADAEEQLEEFVPTEKVPADRGVDFPVDI